MTKRWTTAQYDYSTDDYYETPRDDGAHDEYLFLDDRDQ